MATTKIPRPRNNKRLAAEFKREAKRLENEARRLRAAARALEGRR